VSGGFCPLWSWLRGLRMFSFFCFVVRLCVTIVRHRRERNGSVFVGVFNI
jgi:hypothetical protein